MVIIYVEELYHLRYGISRRPSSAEGVASSAECISPPQNVVIFEAARHHPRYCRYLLDNDDGLRGLLVMSCESFTDLSTCRSSGFRNRQHQQSKSYDPQNCCRSSQIFQARRWRISIENVGCMRYLSYCPRLGIASHRHMHILKWCMQ